MARARQAEVPIEPQPQVLRQNEPPPLCPYCTRRDADGKVLEEVRCLANRSDQYMTRYYCQQRCGFSVKVPRPLLAKRLEREAKQDEFTAR